MTTDTKLKPVVAQAGRPLYQSVRDAVVDAINLGSFRPGDRIPSTKELSVQMAVSLVTAHRALQDLVSLGVLTRTQGRGTFVVDRPMTTGQRVTKSRVAIVFHPDASLGDFYHGQILEGMRQAARLQAVDMVILHYGAVRKDCDGFLFVNPLPGELDAFVGEVSERHPVLVVAARSPHKDVAAIDVDNPELARQAVKHLFALGHRRIGYVGGAEELSNSRDRRLGFMEACRLLELPVDAGHVLQAASWRLDDAEKLSLARMLRGPNQPTALFAAGYYFALDVYEAALTLGLSIPGQLSVVGVDDPPSAAHLSPSMSTLRQPLVQLGHVALSTLHEAVRNPQHELVDQVLRPELVIRQSSAPPT